MNNKRVEWKRIGAAFVLAAGWMMLVGCGKGMTGAQARTASSGMELDREKKEEAAARFEEIKQRMGKAPRNEARIGEWVTGIDAEVTAFQNDFPGSELEADLLQKLCQCYVWHFVRFRTYQVYFVPASHDGDSDYARGFERAEEFLRKFPDHKKGEVMRLVQGMCLLSLEGRRKEGRERLEALGENGSDRVNWRALAHLADYWRFQEQYDKANAVLKSAVDAAPNRQVARIVFRQFPYLDWLGKPLEDLNLTDLEGKRFTSEQLKGKVILVYFWDSENIESVYEDETYRSPVKQIQKLYEEHREKGFLAIGMSLNKDPEGLKAFIAKEKITFPQYHAGPLEGSETARRYNRTGTIPSGLLVDRNGIVRYGNLVHYAFNGKRTFPLEEAVKELVEEAASE